MNIILICIISQIKYSFDWIKGCDKILKLNQIYNMNCLDGMKLIEDKSIDMIFADLPYGKTKNKWDSIIPLEPLWEQYERIIKDSGVILLFGQDKFTAKMMLFKENLHRYNIIWKKTTPTGFLNAKKMPMRIHEDIMVFYKNLPIYNPQKTTGHKRKVSTAEHKRNSEITTNYGNHNLNTYDSTERYPTSIWEFKTDRQKSSLHPTQKPLDLCRCAIRTYSNEGDLILDNCCGSGSIPLSAYIENRNYIGMDNGICEKKNSVYFGWYWADISTDRIKKYKST